MRREQSQETELRRYLLGELTLEEQVLVEQRLFLDGDYSKLAQAVEDDLVDEYLHDDLVASEREKFEGHFLEQPEHKGDLRIAAALKKYLVSDNAVYPGFTTNSSHESQRTTFLPLSLIRKPAVWFALAATISVIISLVTWIAVRTGHKQPSQPLQAQQPPPAQPDNRQQPSPRVTVNGNNERGVETAEHQASPGRPKGGPKGDRVSQPTNSQNSSSSGSSLAFTIYPGGPSRSGPPNNHISISADVGSVLLRLPVKATPPYDSYSATLRSRARMIRHWPDLSTEVDSELGKIVQIDVATSLLSKQSYEIKLAGLPADSRPPETYSFWVDKK